MREILRQGAQFALAGFVLVAVGSGVFVGFKENVGTIVAIMIVMGMVYGLPLGIGVWLFWRLVCFAFKIKS